VAHIICRSGAATAQTAGQAHTPSSRVAAAATEEAAAAKAAAAGGAAGAAAATTRATAAATATKGAAAAAAGATATRAEAARATTAQADSIDADKEEGDRDFPNTGPWRSIKTREPPRACLWTGSQTCERSGGWLVEVVSVKRQSSVLDTALANRQGYVSLQLVSEPCSF